jgi:hypothetical protein
METGHAITISNFKIMIIRCQSFENLYNPTNPNLTIAALTAQYEAANTFHLDYLSGLQLSKTYINNHQILFSALNPLVTRALNLLQSTQASAQIIRDIKALSDIIRGANLNPRTKKDGSPDLDHISNSHQSYVMRTHNFSKLVILYKSEPLYTPNETDLTIAALEAYKDQLQAKNSELWGILSPVIKNRTDRDHLLYDKDTGIIETAKRCKKYVRALFGPRSPEARSITSIKFTRPRKSRSRKKKTLGNGNL